VGVGGSATTGAGVYGQSSGHDGVQGRSGSSNHSGVAGINTGGGIGVFGIGAAALNAAADETYAILGGTERYAGARGTYTARTTSAETTGRGAVEFILTLTA